MVTKADLERVENGLKAEIAHSEATLQAEIARVESALRAETRHSGGDGEPAAAAPWRRRGRARVVRPAPACVAAAVSVGSDWVPRGICPGASSLGISSGPWIIVG